MTRTALEVFVDSVQSTWGPLSTQVVAECREQLVQLLNAPQDEAWLDALHRDASPSTQLYRDATHGFMLLAHTEHAGLYRPPHDHGRGWVIYGIQQGEIEMGSYARIETAAGRVQLVKRDATVVRPGQVMVYLPGDIHDTRCISPSALLFRFTERDLKKEDQVEHRVKRYAQHDGGWTVAA